MMRQRLKPTDNAVAFMTNNGAPSVAIIILNWNGWQDTVECLESCLKLDYPNFRIVVCDNASTDGSVERLRDWAGGRLPAPIEGDVGRQFAHPPSGKPVRLDEFAIAQAPARRFEDLPAITLIQTGKNGGFAAGNNAGLAYASRCGAQFHWLLNNDTVVPPDALSALVERATSDREIGLCGSMLAFYEEPAVLQLAGGCAYYPAFGIARRLGADRPRGSETDVKDIERRMGYVSAASCLVSDDFLRDIGPMNEDYFLYCEEIDWALRANGKYRLAVATDSVVFHKGGRSAGSKNLKKSRSQMSAYYLWRARRMVTLRYHPYGLIGLGALAVAEAGRNLFSGAPKTAGAVLRGIIGLRQCTTDDKK